MLDQYSNPRPWNPAVRRNGVQPSSSLPTPVAGFAGVRAFTARYVEARDQPAPTQAPALRRFRRQTPSDSGANDSGSGSGSSPSGSSGSSASDDGSSASGSGSQSGSQGSTPPPSSGSSQSSGSSVSPSSPPSSPASSPTSQSQSTSASSPSTQSTTTTTTTTSTSSDTQSSTSSQSSSSTASSPSTSASTSQASSSQSSATSTSPTTTPPPSSTSPTSIKGAIQSTITSVITTDINGTSTTFTSLIPTTLSAPAASPMSPATRRAIITGSAIGGSVFVVIIIALFLFCKRSSKLRLNYKKLRVFGHRKQRTMLLDDEDMDEDLADVPGMQRISARYSDNPYPPSLGSRPSSRAVSMGPAFPMVSVPDSTSPHVLGLRASESGSIFREGVWPPPGEGSRFVDPLVSGSNSIDLGRIVGDVMGPSGSVPPSSSQSSFQPSIAVARGQGTGAHSRQTSSTRLLSSTSFPYASGGVEPPGYDYSDAEREHELDLARAQSPDSQVYIARGGPLRIANAGPDSPMSPPHDAPMGVGMGTPSPPGTPQSKPNWLERSPRNMHRDVADEHPQQHHQRQTSQTDEQIVMGEAL